MPNYNEILKNYLNKIINEYQQYINKERLLELENNITNLLFQIKEDNSKEINESLIIKNIFNSLIPSTNNKELDESIIDFCALNMLQKNNEFPEYYISSTKNLIYLKEELQKIDDFESELTMIFNGTIANIIEFNRKDNDVYDELINNISSLFGDKSASFAEYAYKLTARVNNKKEALQIIKESCKELNLNRLEEIDNLINQYLNQNTIGNVLS